MSSSSKKQRVLLVAPVGFGGIQTWCLHYAKALREMGSFEADVLFECYGKTSSSNRQSENEQDYTSVFSYGAKENRSHVCRRLIRTLSSYHVVYPNTSGMTYHALARMGAKRPVAIGACRGDFEHDYGTLQMFEPYLDAIFTVSDLCLRELESRLAGTSLPMTAIPHGSDPGLCRQNPNGPLRLAFTGRFAPVKRLPDLVEIAGLLRQEGVGFRLTLAGDGPLKDELKQLTETKDLGTHIDFPGKLETRQIAELLSESHCLLLLSERESFGLSALEGMAHGAVPIVSNTCGCREAIQHGENGFLVSPGSIEEAARHIIALERDRESWQRFSNAARDTVRKKYSASQILERNLAFLEQARERHRLKVMETPNHVPPFSRLDHPFLPNAATKLLRTAFKRGGSV